MNDIISVLKEIKEQKKLFRWNAVLFGIYKFVGENFGRIFRKIDRKTFNFIFVMKDFKNPKDYRVQHILLLFFIQRFLLNSFQFPSREFIRKSCSTRSLSPSRIEQFRFSHFRGESILHNNLVSADVRCINKSPIIAGIRCCSHMIWQTTWWNFFLCKISKISFFKFRLV